MADFLGAFAKLLKATISFVTSVCPSVRMEHLGFHGTDCHEILSLSVFRKAVEKILFSLKFEKNTGTYMKVNIHF